eukprot:5866331-Amphidinium_carterae.1
MPKKTLEHVPGCPAPDTPSDQSRPTKPLWMFGWPAFQMRVGVAGTLSGSTSSQRTARLSGKPHGPLALGKRWSSQRLEKSLHPFGPWLKAHAQ